MNAFDIGHSAYGRFMDVAAEGQGVIAHRLYGHHLIYDFPTDDIVNIPPFLEHLFSDTFTKQGLPILPVEVLKDTGLIEYCKSITKNWNFVNGFDILSGTVAIYGGVGDFKKYIIDGNEIRTFSQMASSLGIGVFELAIAISSANPFLLVGGILSITSGIKGIFNDDARVYFRQMNRKFSVEFMIESINQNKLEDVVKADTFIKRLSPNEVISKIGVDSFINTLHE